MGKTHTTFPNTKRVKIVKEIGEGNYTQIDNVELFIAMQVLSYSAFKLWLYLASNKPNYKFWLFPSHVEKFTGLPRASYYRALTELKDNGFIYQMSENGATITFHTRSEYFNYEEVAQQLQTSKEYSIDDDFSSDIISPDFFEQIDSDEKKSKKSKSRKSKKQKTDKTDITEEEKQKEELKKKQNFLDEFSFFDEILK